MKTKLLGITAFLMLFGIQFTNGQTKSFEIETDPISFFTNGYNFSFGYSTPHWAVRLVPYKTDLPEWQHDNEGFNYGLIGVSLELNYFFKENNIGLFVGPVAYYSRDEIKSPLGQTKNNDQFLTGLTIGYRIMPFKDNREHLNGFYFTPFFSPVITISNDVIFPEGNSFEYEPIQLWGGIKLGYRINISN